MKTFSARCFDPADAFTGRNVGWIGIHVALGQLQQSLFDHFNRFIHFDQAHSGLGDLVFAQSHTTNLEDMVFTLSDELVLNYVTHNHTGSWNPSETDFIEMVATLIGLSQDFIRITPAERISTWQLR